MNKQDVERLWAKAWQMGGSPQANFAALVLEEAAKQFDLQPHVEMFRPSAADEIRTIAEGLKP